MHRLSREGNTVLVIEHNLDIIKTADWIVDLGPEGGDKGGQIVAEGNVMAVAENKKSYTGQYLKRELEDFKALNKNLPDVKATYSAPAPKAAAKKKKAKV
jgi:excinuclease ABC subunit A